MLTAQRRFEPSVIQQLLDAPHRFRFFQAVRLFEIWLRQHGITHDAAIADYLRFQNSVSLNFPASEIEHLQVFPKTLGRTDVAVSGALQKDELDQIRLTTPFMGFLGSNGALPNHYTEQIAALQLYEKDEGPRAFLDLFSGRALNLFFEAWRKYRLEHRFETRRKDHFRPLLLALAGSAHPALQGRMENQRQGVFDETMAYFAAAFRHRPASAAYIRNVLSEYFSVPVRTEQFIGSWYEVPAQQQTSLGMNNSELGRLALVGARVWQRDLRLRLVIGPLKKKEFENFLPGGQAARSLEKMLTMFTGSSLEYEVQLILAAREVSGLSLSGERQAGRLGWDCFVLAGEEKRNRGDVRYEIHAL